MFAHLKLKSPKVYLTPQQFLDDAVKYFQWAVDTPLLEEQIFQNKGAIIRCAQYDQAHVRSLRMDLSS